MKKALIFALSFLLFSAPRALADPRYLEGDLWRTENRSSIYTPPSATDTLLGRVSTDTVTNKSMSGSSNTFTNIPDGALSTPYIKADGTRAYTGSQSFGGFAITNASNISATANTDSVVVNIKGNGTQTSDLLDVFRSDNTNLFKVTNAGNGTFFGTVLGSNLSGTNTGDVTFSTFGSTPTAAGASLSGQAITLQPADATHGGGVSTVTQHFNGEKFIDAGNFTVSNGNMYNTLGFDNAVEYWAPNNNGGQPASNMDASDVFFFDTVGALDSGLTDNESGHVYLYNYQGNKSIDIYSDGTVSFGSWNNTTPIGELQVAPGGPITATVPIRINGSSDAVQLFVKGFSPQTNLLTDFQTSDGSTVFNMFQLGLGNVAIQSHGQMQITGVQDQNELEVDGFSGQTNPILSAADGNTGFGLYVDGDGTVRAQSANMVMDTAGYGLKVKEGSNAKQGVVTLVAGTKVVSNTSVTATSRIFLTAQSLGTVAVPQALAVTARTAGTSFTITSATLTDTSVVAWEIFEPSP